MRWRTFDLEREPGFLLTRRKRKMDRSASCRDSATANRGGSKYTYIPSKGELEERETLRKSKRVRYPDHHRNDSFAEPSGRRCFSHERLPGRHETDSKRGGEHEHSRSSRASPNKGRYQGGTAIKSAIHVLEDESRESIYQRDSDASFGQRQPHRDTNVSCRYLGESHYHQVEGYSSSPQGMRHNRADRQSRDYKDGYSVKHDSGLSRSGLKLWDEITANDARRSLKGRSHDDKRSSPRKHRKSLSRNEPKRDEETTDKGAPNSTKTSNKVSWGNNIESDSRLSWNGPKWGEETTSKNSPTFSKWGEETTSKDNYVCDKEPDNCSPCNGPNCGEETNSKNAQNSQWKSVANDRDPNVETDNNLSCTGSKWGSKANVKDAPSSWGLPTTKCYPKELHNTSSSLNDQTHDKTWDHRQNTKEASSSSKHISDDKWGYNVKTDNSSSWSKWGDETTTKDAPNSWRSSSTKRDSKKTNISSSYDPKWDDRASGKNAAGFSQWKSDDDKLGPNVKTDNSSSWPKWPDKATTQDGSNSWRSSPAKRFPKETNDHSSWDAPKCDDRATAKDVPSSSQWISKADKWGSNVKTDNSTWPNWGDGTTTKDEPSSWRPSTAQWDSKETSNNSSRNVPNVKTDNSSSWPKWPDKATTQDGSNSWRSSPAKSYPKETNGHSSWDAPKCDDRATAKDVPSSSQWRSKADKWGSNVKTDNSTWPNWGDGTTTKDEPSSWRPSTARWDSKETSNNSSCNVPNVKTDNSSSWPKWPDKATTQDGSNSWRSSPAKSYPKETNDHSSWDDPKCDDRATAKDVPSSSQWRSKADKWGSNVKTDNSTWPNWGDGTTTKDEPSSWRPSTARWDSKETSNHSSCNVPKWDDRVTTDDAPGSTLWRSEVDKWGSNVKTGNSSLWTKWGSGTTDKDEPNSWRSSTAKRDSKETNNDSSWNAPKWDDRGTTKEALGSSRSNIDKWRSNAKSHNSSSWPKWGDETTTNDIHNFSKSGTHADDRQGLLWPRWGAGTTNNDTQNSSQQRRNADRQGSDVKTDNISSWPKWGDDAANNGRQGSNMKIDNSSSWPKWGADSTNNDVRNSSQWRANYDRQDSNVNTDYSSSGNGQKRGDKPTAEYAPNSSWMRANSHRQCSNVETNNSLTRKGTMLGDDDKRAANNMENQKPSWNDRKRDGYRTTKDSPRSSRWRFDEVKQDYSLKFSNNFSFNCPKCDGQTITKNFLNSSQYQSYSERKQNDVHANSRLSQTDSKLGDQNMLHEACQMSLPANEHNITQETSQKVQHILKTSQCPSSNYKPTEQSGKDKHYLRTGHYCSHQVGRSKKSLKPFTDEASAGTPVVLIEPSSRSPSTEPIISDSSNLKHPNVSKESQISPKSLASINTLPSCSSNLEGKLQHGKEQQNTSRSNVRDHDMMEVGNVNKEDEKGIQLFKFALVEFVKEILRPSWQEGHLSKGAHKTIAKKVVDKVTGTLQGNNIPRTQGDVDRYINSCRTELTNLVQAYLQIYAGV
ncbi:uncharacterized protein LOC109850577 [Asparagus officinalis]|uniref:uncharacterized protein LOC109850577 n=1 Tax=Asparagus officinalis TaxID=4686 RepID=UPI00098DF0F6|nr:uncharacterized protein LOC109850577 [Asparagus officinalis]